MSTNAFITNSKAHTLKKRLEELIQHSKELKFLVGFKVRAAKISKTPEAWKAYQAARDQTLSVTEGAGRVKRKIDEKVKALYGCNKSK